MNKSFFKLIILIFISLVNLNAEVICVKNKAKTNRSGKILLAKSIKTFESECPESYTELADTKNFTGEQGIQGKTGEQGLQGEQGFKGEQGLSAVSTENCNLISVQYVDVIDEDNRFSNKTVDFSCGNNEYLFGEVRYDKSKAYSADWSCPDYTRVDNYDYCQRFADSEDKAINVPLVGYPLIYDSNDLFAVGYNFSETDIGDGPKYINLSHLPEMTGSVTQTLDVKGTCCSLN